MSLTFGNVHFTQQPQRVVYVSGSLMKNLKLSGKKVGPPQIRRRTRSRYSQVH